MGDDTGRDVGRLFRGDANEEVGMLYIGLFHGFDTCWRGIIGHHVIFAE